MSEYEAFKLEMLDGARQIQNALDQLKRQQSEFKIKSAKRYIEFPMMGENYLCLHKKLLRYCYVNGLKKDHVGNVLNREGKIICGGYLMVIEHALSPIQLEKDWDKYLNNAPERQKWLETIRLERQVYPRLRAAARRPVESIQEDWHALSRLFEMIEFLRFIQDSCFPFVD